MLIAWGNLNDEREIFTHPWTVNCRGNVWHRVAFLFRSSIKLIKREESSSLNIISADLPQVPSLLELPSRSSHICKLDRGAVNRRHEYRPQLKWKPPPSWIPLYPHASSEKQKVSFSLTKRIIRTTHKENLGGFISWSENIAHPIFWRTI